MKNKFRILKILITVILFGFLLNFSLKRFNDKPLANVTVSLAQTPTPVYFIDEKDVRDMVKRSNPSERIGGLNIPFLEKKLNQMPAVDSANVYLNLNGNLKVDIKQRVPVFRLNKDGRDFYVDKKGTEFPVSPDFSVVCMLVRGNVHPAEYRLLAELIEKINADDFSRKYFIGITKDKDSYNLLTSDGNYKVEIGDLDRIDLKVKGFKTFVEKYLVYQHPEKYTKISVRYDNQIVATLNPHFKENDSIVSAGRKELARLPSFTEKKAEAEKKTLEVQPAIQPVKKQVAVSKPKPPEKPKAVNVPAVSPKKEKAKEKKQITTQKEKPKVEKKQPEQKPVAKPKAKMKIE